MNHPLTMTQTEERIASRIDPSVSREVAVSDAAGGLAFANVNQVMEFAKMMAVASIAVPKHLRGNPGACMAVAIQAIEWRMSPFAVANKSYSVNDRLAYEAQLVQAVILQRAPIKGRFKVEYRGEGERRTCRVWAELKDEPGEIVEYTSPEFSRITPKNSPLWKSDPDQQLFYYSVRAACRRHFPDVLLGVYARDELEEDEIRSPEGARDVTPPRSLSDRLDAIAAAPQRPYVAADDAQRMAGEESQLPPDGYDSPADMPDEADLAAIHGERPADAPEGGQPEDDGADEPAVDPNDPDYQRGFVDRKKGLKKCLSAEIRDDPRRIVQWKYGYDAAEA